MAKQLYMEDKYNKFSKKKNKQKKTGNVSRVLVI